MSTIIGFNGRPRSGKTAALALLGLRSIRRGRKVYSNFPIEGAEYITPFELLKFLKAGAENETESPLYNADICAQEFQTWIESRLGAAKTVLAITDFICQAPKLGFNLYYDTQLNSAVDKRLKQNVFARYEAEKTKTGFRYYQLDIEHTEENVRTGRKKFVSLGYMVKFVFPYYNTRKVSLRPDFSTIMADMESQNPEIKEKTVERQVKLLANSPHLYDYSKVSVEYALMKHHESAAFAALVAIGLKIQRMQQFQTKK